MTNTIRTTAVFLQPFQLASFNDTLPAGEYRIETVLPDPVTGIGTDDWVASVQVHLQARASHPGLTRTLTVPLGELDRAIAKDKLTGKDLTDFFVEEMLADPMIRLVMDADGVCEAEVRALYFGTRGAAGDENATGRMAGSIVTHGAHTGMSPRSGSPRPGIGE